MTAIALNTTDTVNRLYDEADVSVVSGNVSDKVKYKLIDTAKMAEAAIDYAAMDSSLYTDKKPTRMHVKDIRPDRNRVANAYTNGKEMGLNSYVIPGTRNYEIFLDSVLDRHDKFGEYLKEEYGTPQRANETLKETIYHEKIHDKLQFGKLKTKYVQAKNPFIVENLKVSKEYARDMMKKVGVGYMADDEGFLEIIASELVSRRAVEGLTELTKENVLRNKSNYRVHTEKKANGVSTYDKDTEKAAYVLDTLGFNDTFQFYGACIDNPKLHRKYIELFYAYNGQNLSENRGKTIQMVPYMKAA